MLSAENFTQSAMHQSTFSVICHKENNFCDFLFAFMHTKYILQRYLLYPMGVKSFLLEKMPFSEGKEDHNVRKNMCLAGLDAGFQKQGFDLESFRQNIALLLWNLFSRMIDYKMVPI